MDNPLIFVTLALLVGIAVTWAVFNFIVLKSNRERIAELKNDASTQDHALTQQRIEYQAVKDQLVRTEAELNHANIKLKEQKEELENVNNKLTKEFENIANKIVSHQSKEIQDKHEEKLKAMLNPFKEKIESFEKKVDDTHKENIKENQSLKEQINSLKDLNKSISDEAKNLTSALKGDKKLQGNWGENSLERILQAAGLEKEKHYRKEVFLEGEDANFRADYIILLPDDKNLIIDSKVSLVAYANYFAAEEKEEADDAIKQHVQSVRRHVTSLSSKNYAELHGVTSPDYVIMYMPIDSALGMAMTEDPELFDFALRKNIVLVSSNSLLATLKTVAFIWRQDAQNKNALEIARQGGALYDKFVGFVDTLIGVGKKMEDAQQGYRKAMNQLTDGRGNLVKKTEDLKKLGIKATKSLPEKLIDRSSEEGKLEA